MDIFVGNFPFSTTEDELSQAFAEYGTVDRVHLVMDRETGRPRGFGFITMPEPEEAKAAIDALDGIDFNGRQLRCNEARPREERPRRNFNNDNRGGGDRRGGGKRPSGGGDFAKNKDEWGDDGDNRRRDKDRRPRRRSHDNFDNSEF